MSLKISQFATILHDYPEEGKHILYNTLTRAMSGIDEKGWYILQALPYIPNDTSVREWLENLSKDGFVVPQDTDEGERYVQLLEKAKANTDHLHVTLSLIQGCNFGCVYCYQGGKTSTHDGSKIVTKQKVDVAARFAKWEEKELADSINTDEIIAFLESQCQERNVKRLNFTAYGGEPLLNKGALLEVVSAMHDYCQQNGIQWYFNMVSNGSLLNQKTVEELKKYGFVQVQIPRNALPLYEDSAAQLIQQLIEDGFVEVCDLESNEKALAEQISREIANHSITRNRVPQQHYPEAEAIALMNRSELNLQEILLDEQASREIAKARGLSVISFASVLFRACEEDGLISPEVIRHSLFTSQSRGIYYSRPFIAAIFNRLQRSGRGDRGLAATHIQRYSDVSFPSHTVVGETEALRVAITVRRTDEGALPLRLEVAPDEPDSMKVDVFVNLSPSDFELEGNVQTIEVPPNSDSEPIIFKLVPKREGQKVIGVEFFQNTRYLGCVEIETIVTRKNAAAEPSPDPASEQVELNLDGFLQPPDLTILFDRVDSGSGPHYYRYRLLSQLRHLNLSFEEFHTDETRVEPEEILKAITDQLREGVSDKRLNGIGVDLYNRLFPDGLKSLYWDRLRAHVKNLLIISYEPWVPWEMIRPSRQKPDGAHEEDKFLCEKFNLTRWLNGNGPLDGISLNALALVIDNSSLRYARCEGEKIEQLLDGTVTWITPSFTDVFDLLSQGAFSGLHFVCHGQDNPINPDASSIFLQEGTLQPLDLNGEGLNFGNDRPLVFLNACRTARSGYALTGLGGWAEAFIRRARSSGFIGSMWELDDEAAYKFAVAFYRNLVGDQRTPPKTVAEAVKLARAKIKRPGNPTWLSYTVYANPLARLVT